MLTVKPLPEFLKWLDGLKDGTVRGAVLARIKRTQKQDIKRAKALAALLD
jgi:putative component of toxin-antitoxin plasmid stabilization module